MDKSNQGHKVGKGVYLYPLINAAENYAGKVNLEGKNFKVILMVRVKNNKLRSFGSCKSLENYYIVNAAIDEVRPYRILLKNVN